jgi:serine/threonine-protein kinase RsbW
MTNVSPPPETITLPATLDALAAISQFVAAAAEATGLDPRTTWQIQLAVDEAATNIIQYAYPHHTPGDLIVTWATANSAVTITLRDQGCSFDPHNVPPPDLLSPLEERQVGGLGIYLMTRLMNEVRFNFDPQLGNVLTMVKYLQHDEAEQVSVLPLHGRLDAQTAPHVNTQAQRLIEAGTRCLIIDLEQVNFISSSGLRILLIIRKELMMLGGELRLAALPPRVREVFDLTGFAQVFAIYPSVAAARPTVCDG